MRLHRFALAALAFSLSSAAFAATAPLTVVYWSAKDCRWCTWWEGSVIGSGGEAKFLQSDEGKAVSYAIVKKPRLSTPYVENDFKADQKWLWPRVRDQVDGRIKGFPSFSLFEGEKLVVYAVGEEEFAEKLLPVLKEKLKR
jgi:hypothetical protein